MTSRARRALLRGMDALLALCCRHVAEGTATILRAARGEAEAGEAEWRFGCGSEDDLAEPRRAPLEDLIRRDPTAVEIVLHPRGTSLERRAAGARWLTGSGPVLFPHRPSRRWPGLDPRFAPRPGEALEAADLALLADVAERGWHVFAAEPAGEVARAFTVGLFRSFDHPELAVLGLPRAEAVGALDRLAARVREGERVSPEDVVEGVVDGRLATFRAIPPRRYAAWLGYAVWYHDGARFPALQCVWSDAERRFPWDPWFPRAARAGQPVLYEAEPA